MKVLVTGGAGFIGSHLVRALISRGVRVRVLDNFMGSPKENLRDCRRKIDLVEGDIRLPRDVRRALEGMEAVFHLAANRSVMKSVENPLLNHEINATGTLLLLRQAVRAGVRHFVFTSTSAVYGAAVNPRQKENDKPQPISPYGVAKLAAEHYARYFYHKTRLPTTSVRIFNVYGPRQNPESRYSLVVPGVLSKIFRGQRPVIDGSGEQSRDFIFIGDILSAFFKILGNRKTYGKVYNLGSGKAFSIRMLVRTLLKITGSDLKPVHGPRRAGDPDRTCADIRRAWSDFGWQPQVSLEEGLRRTLEWYRK